MDKNNLLKTYDLVKILEKRISELEFKQRQDTSKTLSFTKTHKETKNFIDTFEFVSSIDQGLYLRVDLKLRSLSFGRLKIYLNGNLFAQKEVSSLTEQTTIDVPFSHAPYAVKVEFSGDTAVDIEVNMTVFGRVDYVSKIGRMEVSSGADYSIVTMISGEKLLIYKYYQSGQFLKLREIDGYVDADVFCGDNEVYVAGVDKLHKLHLLKLSSQNLYTQSDTVIDKVVSSISFLPQKGQLTLYYTQTTKVVCADLKNLSDIKKSTINLRAKSVRTATKENTTYLFVEDYSGAKSFIVL